MITYNPCFGKKRRKETSVKQRLWVLIRTADVSIHNTCFGQRSRKDYENRKLMFKGIFCYQYILNNAMYSILIDHYDMYEGHLESS